MEYLLIILLTILAVIELFKKDKKSKWIIRIIIILLIIITIAQLIIQSENEKKDRRLQYSGKLESESKVIFSFKHDKYPPLEI